MVVTNILTAKIVIIVIISTAEYQKNAYDTPAILVWLLKRFSKKIVLNKNYQNMDKNLQKS